MRFSSLQAASICVALSLTSAASAQGQRPATPQATPRAAAPAAPAATRIAVLDVKLVFEKHLGFENKLKAIETQVKSMEQLAGEKQRELTARQKQAVEAYKPESPEYESEYSGIAQAAAQFKVQQQLQKKNILSSEAKVYFQTYQEIEEAVRQICQHYGYQLVIRFDSREMDPLDRGSVLAAVNRNVVFQNGIDITQTVIQMVNRNQSAQRQAGPAPR